LQISQDFESTFFLASGKILKIEVHINNGVIEGEVVDVRDELTISTKESIAYVPWENIVYFEIVKDDKGLDYRPVSFI